jgi:hypothetical protein
MSTSIAAASPWPARAAYFSAAIFTGASGTINVTYGWQKGSDLAGSLTWSAVAAAVAIVFALSWPALIRSLETRRWSAAMVALVALVLAGSYSVTAALGSAAGGRANAAITETATIDARRKAQDAYDAAKAELATLKPARPVAELEAIVARNPEAGGRCTFLNGSIRTVCPPHPLAPELARAKRRAELEGKIERAAGELASTGPTRQANSDAKALSSYLLAVGLDTDAERVNKLLVLLAVLMIEAGGGLSLALGMALGGRPPSRDWPHVSSPPDSGRPTLNAPDALPFGCPTAPGTVRVQPAVTVRPPDDERDGAVVGWLRGHGGRTVGVRRLADALGRPRSTVSDQLRRLASQGHVSLTRGRRGLVIELAAGARPN